MVADNPNPQSKQSGNRYKTILSETGRSELAKTQNQQGWWLMDDDSQGELNGKCNNIALSSYIVLYGYATHRALNL